MSINIWKMRKHNTWRNAIFQEYHRAPVEVHSICCRAAVVGHLPHRSRSRVMRDTRAPPSPSSGRITADSRDHEAVLHVTQLHAGAAQARREEMAAGSPLRSRGLNGRSKCGGKKTTVNTSERWAFSLRSNTQRDLIIKCSFHKLTPHPIISPGKKVAWFLFLVTHKLTCALLTARVCCSPSQPLESSVELPILGLVAITKTNAEKAFSVRSKIVLKQTRTPVHAVHTHTCTYQPVTNDVLFWPSVLI